MPQDLLVALKRRDLVEVFYGLKADERREILEAMKETLDEKIRAHRIQNTVDRLADRQSADKNEVK